MKQTDDEHFMGLALRLAARARGRTSPNPLVGAVVVKDGTIVGQGYHRRAGTDHAEAVALRRAGAQAHHADLFVNLEPCNHVGRTGPCARCIVDAGIRRVIIGLRDPNPLVNGRGIRALRRAGVQVTCGVLEEECRQLNKAFICTIQHHRPWVILKSAITLDGRIAARSGDSRWVTGEKARLAGHRLRDQADAIIVGVGTVLIDDPQLTCRGLPRGRDPLRIVVDSRLRTPPLAKVVAAAQTSPAETWIVTTEEAPRQPEWRLKATGARVIRLPAKDKQVNLAALLQLLHQRELMSVLLEGGATLAGAFWQEGLVDHLITFIAPKILGDPQAVPMIAGQAITRMTEAALLRDVRVRTMGDDILVEGSIQTPGRER